MKIRCERCGHDLGDKHIELDPDDMRALLREELGKFESAPVPIYAAAPDPDDFPIRIVEREKPEPFFGKFKDTSGRWWITIRGLGSLPNAKQYSERAVDYLLTKLNRLASERGAR